MFATMIIYLKNLFLKFTEIVESTQRLFRNVLLTQEIRNISHDLDYVTFLNTSKLLFSKLRLYSTF